MSLLYERKETSDEVTIKYKYWPLFYFVLILIVPLSMALNILGIDATFIGTLAVIILILFFVDHLKPNKELRKAIKEGRAQIQGSKLSFSRPYTALIKKK